MDAVRRARGFAFYLHPDDLTSQSERSNAPLELPPWITLRKTPTTWFWFVCWCQKSDLSTLNRRGIVEQQVIGTNMMILVKQQSIFAPADENPGKSTPQSFSGPPNSFFPHSLLKNPNAFFSPALSFLSECNLALWYHLEMLSIEMSFRTFFKSTYSSSQSGKCSLSQDFKAKMTIWVATARGMVHIRSPGCFTG